ncbi:putative beta-galactosidase [Helianthus annuus]|uniref:Beta-galactosidase n=1 Tax=Helianthus annuus TaxID=4232 RepID=A0A251VJN8_HELAN|nr:beta-galactosidase 9 [Helianthus annuus]KAF5820230.1 putative beta-galactosidase [Helianthus annuus]KAJ0620297.1 putative beta-galactosidase [Helianthus annuus]
MQNKTLFGFGLQWLTKVLIVTVGMVSGEYFKPFNVSYDHRALIIDGQRRMLISAGIHYPRATPEMWPDLIGKSKEGGADVIQTYVFWSGHEPVRGQYNFQGRYDLVKFVKLVGETGLYLHLRIGPYVCAEWNFGGFPVWLRDIPGIVFRTDNEPFKEEMKRFVKKIVDVMRDESLFSWQGGPIIMLQIENEYGNIESSYGQKGKEYVKWAANMAVGLGAGVPWVMCRQTDAPENIIDACNGYYCDGFKPNSNKKPVLWTENWDGWYTTWGGRLPHRPVEDLAFAVARFYQRGGSFQNYYMFFGGTNFGRTSGGPNYVTSYDYDAPIDEYGLLSQPKWGHLKDLHAAIKLCEPALVSAESAQYITLGSMQEAHVYRGGNTSICSAFLANIDEHKTSTVQFLGRSYTLPPWSVSILPDCKNAVFNTAKVGAQTSIKLVDFEPMSSSKSSSPEHLMIRTELPLVSESWMTLKEPIGAWGDDTFTVQGLLEHLNVTKDQSDYLWYITRVYVSDEDIAYWKENAVTPSLKIDSMRDVVRIFINEQLIGSERGHWVKVVQDVELKQGYNDVMLLSQTVGLQNYGAFLEKDGAGFKGQITLTGLKNGDVDLTHSTWTYQVGLKGEFQKLYANDDDESLSWTNLTHDEVPSVLSWYKTHFDSPGGKDPVVVDMSSMGKGQAWVNGHHIGRYWTLVAPKDGCQENCNYRGAYNSGKCQTNCGKPTQIWYHVPRSWLQPSDNLLVVFEETGGSPFEVSVKTVSVEAVCAHVSEDYYPPVKTWSQSSYINGKLFTDQRKPVMELQCEDGYTIASIEFASYGTPQGSCQSFSTGNCHAPTSSSILSKACEGRNRCKIEVSNSVFGDPCPRTVKTLAVKARCKPSLSSSSWYTGLSEI